MDGILIGLACWQVALFAATSALGAGWIRPPGGDFSWHVWGGLISAIYTVLCHALVFVYFLGSGRYIKETVLAHRFPVALHDRSRRLKFQAYPWSLAAALATIAAAVLGAGADTGAVRGDLHGWVALAALAVNLVTFARVHRVVRRNMVLMRDLEGYIDALPAPGPTP